MTTEKDDFLQRAAVIEFVVFDFDGVFTDNRVVVFQDGSEAVFCSRSDGLGLEMLKRAGFQVMVLSKERNPVVAARCRKLSLDCRQGVDDKVPVLEEEAERRSVPLSRTAYMGNDLNDLECMKRVGFPACVADAYAEVKEAALFCTVSPGGFGAVRELCDLLIRSRTENGSGK